MADRNQKQQVSFKLEKVGDQLLLWRAGWVGGTEGGRHSRGCQSFWSNIMLARDWKSKPGVPTAESGFILGSKTLGPERCRKQNKIAQLVPGPLL